MWYPNISLCCTEERKSCVFGATCVVNKMSICRWTVPLRPVAQNYLIHYPEQAPLKSQSSTTKQWHFSCPEGGTPAIMTPWCVMVCSQQSPTICPLIYGLCCEKQNLHAWDHVVFFYRWFSFDIILYSRFCVSLLCVTKVWHVRLCFSNNTLVKWQTLSVSLSCSLCPLLRRFVINPKAQTSLSAVAELDPQQTPV